jgi:hypothetical protein
VSLGLGLLSVLNGLGVAGLVMGLSVVSIVGSANRSFRDRIP